MQRPSRTSLILASVAAFIAIALILPTPSFSFDDPRIRTAGVLVLVAIAIVIAAAFGVGAKTGAPDRGRLADAEVLELKEDARRWKGETITVWVARVRYRDAAGGIHEGIIDDCNEDDCARLRPGTSTKIRYNEQRPKAFVWTPDET